MVNNLLGSYGIQPKLYSAAGHGDSNVQFRQVQKDKKQQLIQKQYNDIFEHEQAHKNAAGEYGGAIVIDKNSEGIPVGGHVDIKMPVRDKNNPDKTIKHADTVIKSALAPGDPSGQDYKVAAEAKSIKAQAQNDKNDSRGNKNSNNKNQIGNNLNFIA